LFLFYSHKIKIPFSGKSNGALMAVIPFCHNSALLQRFDIWRNRKLQRPLCRNFFMQVFFSSCYLWEMIKDLENIKGDLASGYRTILFYNGKTYLKNHHRFNNFNFPSIFWLTSMRWVTWTFILFLFDYLNLLLLYLWKS
jgi:4-hydroxybenzoate polyprenyltransferase